MLGLALVAELLRNGSPVRFRANGRSMTPTIRHGEMVTAVPVAPSALRVSDVVVYLRGDRLFVHRVVKRDGEGTVVTRGDNMPEDDLPVAATAVLGRVVAVERFWRKKRI